MYAVLKGAGYFMAHAPEMTMRYGTTQSTQRIIDPDAAYLKEIKDHMRTFDEFVGYMPNQVYIGSLPPDDLSGVPLPWYDKPVQDFHRTGKLGSIMPEDEFIGMMKLCDVFDLVMLETDFAASVKSKLEANPLIDNGKLDVLDKPVSLEEIESFIAAHGEPLYFEGKLIGCVKAAHDIDENLSAHVLIENLVSKASCVLSILNLLDKNGLSADSVDYMIECSEEAVGDMNQRGGGNMAKAAAEIAGLHNATGCDVRGFCAGPAHALVQASSLVKSGVFKNVIVAAGGSTAKLGMNGKDHVKKGMPILEDAVAGFAVLIGENDGVNPEINTDILGKHMVNTGSSPQNVISSLTAVPLEKAGLTLSGIDKYSVEMQNPDITKPAGAGNVPEANYKMIGALAAMRGEIEKKELMQFVAKHGMTGWAPTQGHIPSGVPYLGFARQDILDGKINRVMIIGKGSLFLGRMTNLFDGISFVIQANPGSSGDGESSADGETAHQNSSKQVDISPRCGSVAVTAIGSELGEDVIYEAAKQAAGRGIAVKVIGSKPCSHPNVEVVHAESAEESHSALNSLLASGEASAGVTMHYPFPIGVSTVGRVVTPATGRGMYIATTTGTSSTDRVEGMVRNAVSGIAAAKACGIENPTVGIVNIDGARQAETALKKLKANGYDIEFASSGRSDGGCIMRGNDLITASADVMVTDPLTGNILMKMFSAFNSGGSYETVGYGYGPGLGEDFNKLVLIISRASGTPVVRGAIEFADELICGNIADVFASELRNAKRAGLDDILLGLRSKKGDAASAADSGAKASSKEAPPKEIVTEEIMGVEIMELDEAVAALWDSGVYAESGMGCTGPVILVSESSLEKAKAVLAEKGYIN